MGKMKSWLNLLKGFFLLETYSKTEKKEKRGKWMFGRAKVKRLPSIAAPSPPRDRTLNEPEEEQGRHALTVALATAAAAEAAVAAAHAAAEVVRLTSTPQSTRKCQEEREAYTVDIQADSPKCTVAYERRIQELAVIKIQSAFRGYLARKALRALKGIVKLQAIIRGRVVRCQAMTTLKCLQSMVNIQSQVCARRFQIAETASHFDENKQLPQTFKDKIIKVDTNSQKRWDDSTLTKKEAEAMVLSKKEAAIKRERIKEYAYTHRKSAECELNKGNGRWKYWLDNWVDTQVARSKELEVLDSVWTSNPKPAVEDRAKHLKLRTFRRQYPGEELQSPVFIPRRSFHHRKQCSLGEDNSFPASPVVPTYMVATESAKAKVRSLSSPKLRPGSYDTHSESYSPYKNKLSLISSVTTEVPSNYRMGRAFQPSSPRLKGLNGPPGPVKSSRTLKDLTLNSDCPLPYRDQQNTFG
ncbi:hypothetical protein SLEP1_g5989 [Rubroshorea leprosula]|uniref:DUF4005 domain-containing protein n=1 Tax=Rubroshorea leprosula TaxID=152421 RepID=A0AAV5HZZ6_9ROSI|nr:hypothetical protein SLEP1_g5989 [Rubroshorea leprosula]